MNADIKNKLLKQISVNFPEVHWKSARYISSGFDNDVIILDNTTVFRFPKNSYSRKILKDEVALLAFLAKQISTSLPVYKFIAKNYSCGGYPMIKGSGLTKNKFKTLSATQQRHLAMKLGTFLTELHTIPVSSIKNFNPRERYAEKELKQLSKDATKYLYPAFSLKEKGVFNSFFTNLDFIFKQIHKKVLVHGDFSSDHFIINQKNELTGIIDFTDKAIHDPAFDFIFLWEFGSSFVRLVYKYYAGSQRNGILERSNTYGRASAIWNMIQAKRKGKMSYSNWYRRFKYLHNLSKNEI
ncbi:MAG: hypothetical protein A3I29_01020 [Candidatus Magasanikbacteria bacterium RIFCSPLOWO2_02_FULL_44_11]|uniref:Aminoglycoside phosphotransferase domain-containing protein n=2 Tax=Candidatus Magasanikiibacteriota TaxID=1752731 RepID=A0A1F6NAA1_9BACT|nr:MAG: hypothetical protein A3D53_02155 [Candidatus Magasanikbacteria bacterium RIFCSPHIGHO2_02_FULL_45_10]OGH80680.1 MAG: hypothetical protein A3I29_01020 [Candidatus Magasanikbacteria bacterium RIFCSPLOWO2_02_FULL_44_11]